MDAGGDIQIYPTIEEAERDLELSDLDDPDVGVYDAAGRPLTLTDASTFARERVAIGPSAPHSEPPSALRRRLERSLEHAGKWRPDLGAAPIEVLIARLASGQGELD